MDYTIGLAANGNEVTEYHDLTACGDFPGCHAEPPTCGHPPIVSDGGQR